MEILVAVGIGVGLASVAGVRPSPYADVGDGWWWPAFGVFAVLEIVLDKIPALDRALSYVMVPVRAFAGGVLFTAALGFDLDTGSLPWLAAGAAIAGVVAVLEVVLRPSKRVAAAGVSAAFLSFSEDIVALVGGALGFFVPLLPLLLVAFLLFFLYRVRRRRARKYGGLRILGD
jgi:hypothetical protein